MPLLGESSRVDELVAPPDVRLSLEVQDVVIDGVRLGKGKTDLWTTSKGVKWERL